MAENEKVELSIIERTRLILPSNRLCIDMVSGVELPDATAKAVVDRRR